MLPPTGNVKVPEEAIWLISGLLALIFFLSLFLVGIVTFMYASTNYSTIERDKYLIDKFFAAYPDCGTAAAHVQNKTEIHLTCFDEQDQGRKKKRRT